MACSATRDNAKRSYKGKFLKRYLCQYVPLQEEKPQRKFHDKIIKIVEDISKLTVIELVQLNDCLKTTLKIPDAPIMQSQPASVTESAAKVQPKVDEAPKKTKFFVKLTGFPPENKIKVIKLVREINPNLSLVDAKKLVESVPCSVKENIGIDETNKIKSKLEEVGCTIDVD